MSLLGCSLFVSLPRCSREVSSKVSPRGVLKGVLEGVLREMVGFELDLKGNGRL